MGLLANLSKDLKSARYLDLAGLRTESAHAELRDKGYSSCWEDVDYKIKQNEDLTDIEMARIVARRVLDKVEDVYRVAHESGD
jgi:hypothetical protein